MASVKQGVVAPDETATGARTEREGAGTLVGSTLEHLSNLVRGEVDLARAELNESLSKTMTAAGLLVGAVVIALVALNVLAAALTAALAETGLGAGWAALIVGGVLLVVALILAMKGRSDLKLQSLAPTRTFANVKRDAQTITESTDAA
ncbi:phage holin family protein [Silicimonas algicola]|uniref:Putative superfamily III holin-X n=1 Tax=Silicimonas algicola TaxID=1826607 RepID=A0A316FX74_9RHOB|nr:phage holin family protein [Silicimonas algicola]AZQ67570.1 phage holin family protein [Silicimonas algicola]PWK52725.1 putative superfamily III holin-X [Silicimonas algicola]